MNATQGTPEWLQARAGCLTASAIADIMAKGKGGAESAGRANLRARLVAERLTGTPTETFQSEAMRWGTEQETFARAAYEIRCRVMVDQVGLVMHPELAFAGASPDGLVGDDGLVEIKSPNTATHIEYLLDGNPPRKYQPQMLWQMECTGRAWCDFVSYDPRMPEELQLLVVRFERDDQRIKELRDEAVRFLAEVESTIDQLINKAA